jgi:hypothetical protein
MVTKGKTTTDHEEILRWAEARGAHPVAVADAARDGPPPYDGRAARDGSAAICLTFPERSGEEADGLAPITWEEWFRRFEDHGLALLIEETTSTGERSLFNKLVKR